jgi:hypothetical protein
VLRRGRGVKKTYGGEAHAIENFLGFHVLEPDYDAFQKN